MSERSHLKLTFKICAESCPAPTNASGYTIVNNIRSVAQNFGSVKLFKSYLEVAEQVPTSRSLVHRSELQSSGISLTDCPRNGGKDVADKMIIGVFASSHYIIRLDFFHNCQWTC